MARLVMKFGGTSVADIDRIRNVAHHVKREVDAGHEVAVVVSAMAGVTNQLVAWCEDALKERHIFDAREYDAVVASGEQVTAGLLAITLQDMDINARSWLCWQLPIETSNVHASARILEIDGAELVRRFDERKEVAVIAGFQGVHKETGRITTLGRGGSDRGGALRHLYRRRRRLHVRSACRAAGSTTRKDRIRRNVGARFTRRQGDAGALSGARHGAQCAHFRTLKL